MKRAWRNYILIIVLGFLCGCETVGAFGTGRITRADIAYITHAGTLGKMTTPVNVNSTEADAGFEAAPDALMEPSGRRIRPGQTVSKADAWLDENLW
jgi:hypothetical protein